MIKSILKYCSQNRNLLMLIIVFVYISALCSVLYGNIILIALLLSILFTVCIVKEYLPIKIVVLFVIIFYLGIINTSSRVKETDYLMSLCPADVKISGKIISIPQLRKNNYAKFFIKAEEIRFDGIVKSLKNEKVLVSLQTNVALKLYDSYIFEGRLSTPSFAKNPSQYDYSKYLQNFDAYTVLYCKNLDNKQNSCYHKLDNRLSVYEKFSQDIGNFREKVLSIHSKYIKTPNLEILGGIVFGDDAVSTPENIKQSFADSGLLHILAASGMNVAFIFSFFFLILNLLKFNYKINVICCGLAIVVYTLMTGMGASIIRASLMLGFVLFGKLIDREANSIALLSFVAFIMLIYNPLYINDVGFQLSFLATFGLLLTVPLLINHKNVLLNKFIGVISIPIIAQIWVLPIQIYFFGNISLYSVFANIMSVPILSIVSFGGFISSLAANIPLVGDIFCKYFDYILNPLINFIVNISDFWGNLPNASIQTTHPHIFQIILYYCLVINITLLFDKELREKIISVSKKTIPILLVILILFGVHIPNKNLEIIAFDVGNADSFLIKTPENQYIIIDTGKNIYNSDLTQADVIILKYLKDNGISNIDTLILTHFDDDHCGGAVSLLNNLSISKLYVNDDKNSSEKAQEIYKSALNNKTKIIKAENNKIIYDNNFKLTNFISDYKEKDDNESSIITLLEYGEFSMLFTGDAGIRSYYNLKNYLPNNITVLKVPHHGASGTVNKQVMQILNPKISLISTGANKYGHPSEFTINMLKDSKILRTDIHNSIKFAVNKNNYKIYNYDSKKRRFTAL